MLKGQRLDHFRYRSTYLEKFKGKNWVNNFILDCAEEFKATNAHKEYSSNQFKTEQDSYIFEKVSKVYGEVLKEERRGYLR